jgi:cation diffusion facilitator CzcD-associated flavoprotein CzcO
MLFIRILGAGYDVNGNWKNKIIAYKCYEVGKELYSYDYLSKDKVKELFHGRYNADKHTLTTFDTKQEIIDILKKYQQETKEEVSYIFE